MDVRCYFRDKDSTNNVGRVDVHMPNRECDYCPEMVYEDAIAEVQALFRQSAKPALPVLAVVK